MDDAAWLLLAITLAVAASAAVLALVLLRRLRRRGKGAPAIDGDLKDIEAVLKKHGIS